MAQLVTLSLTNLLTDQQFESSQGRKENGIKMPLLQGQMLGAVSQGAALLQRAAVPPLINKKKSN